MTDEHRAPGESPRVRFDEQAALAELEALRRDLDTVRRRREAAAAAFDAFIRAFGERPAGGDRTGGRGPAPRVRTAGYAAAPSQVAPPGRRLGEAAGPAAASASAGEPGVANVAASDPAIGAAPPPELTDFDWQTGSAPRTAWSRVWPPAVSVRAALAVAGVLVVIVLLMLVTRTGREEPAISRDAAAAPPPATAAALAEGERTAAEPGASHSRADDGSLAAASQPGATELLALRRVWLRVTADGQRVLERELDAGARIPLAAGQTVTVRIGDAGAVRLFVRGEDQGILGRDGDVVSRTFTVR